MEVSPPNLQLLESVLTVTRSRATREYGKFKFETYEDQMFSLPDPSRLVSFSGFTTRVISALESANIVVDYHNFSKQLPEPDLSRIDISELRSEQKDMLAAVIGSDGGIIVAPTGTGKSYLIRTICRYYPDLRIMVVAPSKDVV